MALVLAALLWFTPVITLVLTALKDAGDFAINGAFSLPKSIRWANFSEAWETGVKNYFWNSVIVTAVKVPIGIVLESMAAFRVDPHAFQVGGPDFYLHSHRPDRADADDARATDVVDERAQSHRYVNRFNDSLHRFWSSLRGVSDERLFPHASPRLSSRRHGSTAVPGFAFSIALLCLWRCRRSFRFASSTASPPGTSLSWPRSFCARTSYGLCPLDLFSSALSFPRSTTNLPPPF